MLLARKWGEPCGGWFGPRKREIEKCMGAAVIWFRGVSGSVGEDRVAVLGRRRKINARGSCGEKRRRGCSVGSERRGCWFCEMGGCEWGKRKMVSGGLGTKK